MEFIYFFFFPLFVWVVSNHVYFNYSRLIRIYTDDVTFTFSYIYLT